MKKNRPYNLTNEIENKLTLLYIIHIIGMVSKEELWPFVTEEMTISYIDMCIFLDKFIDEQTVEMGHGKFANSFMLTTKGEQIIDSLSDIIPASKKLKIDSHAKIHTKNISDQQKIRVVHQSSLNGWHRVSLIILEEDFPTLECYFETTSDDAIQLFIANAKQNASKLLILLYCYNINLETTPSPLPIETNMNVAIESAKKNTVSICKHAINTYSIIFYLTSPCYKITTSLLFSNLDQALNFAHIVKHNTTDIFNKMGDLLW